MKQKKLLNVTWSGEDVFECVEHREKERKILHDRSGFEREESRWQSDGQERERHSLK